MHEAVIQNSQDSGINVLSMGADGAATKLSAQEKLHKKSTQRLTYSNLSLDVLVKVPLLGSPLRPLVTIQGPKHSRKTTSNQLLLGSRLITIGRFVVCIQQLAKILQQPQSPLLAGDVFNWNKQDDGSADWTLSSENLAYSLAHDYCTNLTIYLFVLGEMCDTWLNKSISHYERLQYVWMAALFLRQWQARLLKRQDDTNGSMSFNLKCISHTSFKIFSNLTADLLGLIISHWDYYPEFLLLPCKHGTKASEQIFEWMRVILPWFSVFNARLMMPKIFSVIKSVMCGTWRWFLWSTCLQGTSMLFHTKAKMIISINFVIFLQTKRYHNHSSLLENKLMHWPIFLGWRC